jgi:hypothetical protein
LLCGGVLNQIDVFAMLNIESAEGAAPEGKSLQLRMGAWNMGRSGWSKSSLGCFTSLPVLSACASVFALGCSPAAGGGDAMAILQPGTGDMGGTGNIPSSPNAPPVNPMPGAGGGDVFVDPNDAPVAGPTDVAGAVKRRGLLEKRVACPGGDTTISGTVYIPSGKLPLYNAMVYVPDAELRPLTPGVSCTCEISGEPIASALTDSSGHFVLSNVPVGADIPIVIQVGDWRREFKIPNVSACADTPVPDQTLRLPARQSEGDIPRIAVATGQLDALECLVRKLGVDESEFTNPLGNGRVTLFAGEYATDKFEPRLNDGQDFPQAGALYYDKASLEYFDIVLLSCNGPGRSVDPGSLQGMYDYLNAGGRVFGSHLQSIWFEQGPAPFPDLAEYDDSLEDLNDVTGEVVTSFPKGAAMADWLVSAGASDTPGQIQIKGAQHNIVSENPAYAQRWIATEEPEPTVQYISANTPLGASDAQQCGRLVLSDIHVSEGADGDISDNSMPFPSGCVTTDLSPQEAALAFMLFDLSACIVPDDQAPVAPTIY